MDARGGPASWTPLPSTADKEIKADMRGLIAAASDALGTANGAGVGGEPAASSEVRSAFHSASSSRAEFAGYMSSQSMEHHAALAHRHAQAQLAADRSASPEPNTLPFPSFLTQSCTPLPSTSPAVAATQPATPAGSVTAAVALPTSSKATARVPPARKGSKRPVINPGIGSQPFTSERARAAATKRWSAAATRRRGKGILALASLPGASVSAPRSATGGLSLPEKSLMARGPAEASGSLLAGRSAGGGEAAATAGLLALTSSPIHTAGTASAAKAAPAVASQASVAALSAAKSSNRAKTTAATKAAVAARATKAASGENSIIASQTGSVVGGGDAAEIANLKKEVATLKGEVADLLKLKVKLANLVASVNMNTEQLSTHGHSMEVLATSFNNLKVDMRTSCKPAQRPSPGSDADEDGDEEEPPARKRVRFAVNLAPTPPSKTVSWAPQTNNGATTPPADEDVPLPSPTVHGMPPPPANYEMLQAPLPAANEVPPPPANYETLPPLLPAIGARGMTVAPRSRPRRPTARVGDLETRDEMQARRRAEGSIVMQCIRDLLNPRVTEMVSLATVSRNVFLDPETKFEMIVENAMEFMGVGADEANVFLLEMVDQPTKKRVRGGAKPKTVRACAPLGMVFSHAMWAIKAVVVAAWFNAVNSSPTAMTSIQAVQWKLDRRYGQSDGGRVGIIAASKQMFIHLNVRHRIKEPTAAGQVAVVHETMGHYGLICTFVAEVLEAVATGVKIGGPDGDRFKRYVAEMVSLDKYMPNDDKEHNGLVLVDGGDPNRAKFPEECMPVPDDDANNPAGAPVVAPVLVA